MLYTLIEFFASFLSFLLQELKKPVMLIMIVLCQVIESRDKNEDDSVGLSCDVVHVSVLVSPSYHCSMFYNFPLYTDYL